MARKSSMNFAPSMPPDFQAEDDHRTLQRAGEVMSSPSRMAGARRHHKKVLGAMNKVLGGRPPSFRGGGR
jgi:hypothetical protein